MFIHLLHLGRVGYAEGLAIQARVIAARKAGAIGDTLLLLEHPAVITLGRNSSRANVLASDEWLAARNVELHEINRGGDVTYHGPGQLVGYPIFDLRGEWPGKRGPFLGPVDFVRMMEEALIRVCADFGVMAKRIPKCTGVWTFGGEDANDTVNGGSNSHISEVRCGAPGGSDIYPGLVHPTHDDETVMDGAPEHRGQHAHISETRCGAPDSVAGEIREKKLAAIGIHVSQGVTSHGFALNVTTDLREFEWIVPCGITDRGVTSVELEASGEVAVTMEAAMHSAARRFGQVFARQMVWCESLEQLLEAAASEK